MELAYEEFGDPDRPAVIIIHGFLASSRNWRSIGQNLSDTFHVLVPDMRNHGNSPHDAVMDYPAMAQDLFNFIRQRRLARISLLGHSMGGKVAMWFALNHPACAASLIVADIAPIAYRHRFDHTLNALKALPLADVQNRKQAENWLSPMIADQSYRQFLLQNLALENGRYRWRIDLDVCSANGDNIAGFPPVEDLPRYTGKTLFIAGENSGYVDFDAATALFPLARLKIVAGAGHWLHVQRPIAFLEQVRNFLSGTEK